MLKIYWKCLYLSGTCVWYVCSYLKNYIIKTAYVLFISRICYNSWNISRYFFAMSKYDWTSLEHALVAIGQVIDMLIHFFRGFNQFETCLGQIFIFLEVYLYLQSMFVLCIYVQKQFLRCQNKFRACLSFSGICVDMTGRVFSCLEHSLTCLKVF